MVTLHLFASGAHTHPLGLLLARRTHPVSIYLSGRPTHAGVDGAAQLRRHARKICNSNDMPLPAHFILRWARKQPSCTSRPRLHLLRRQTVHLWRGGHK